jgi:hypothetical protein
MVSPLFFHYCLPMNAKFRENEENPTQKQSNLDLFDLIFVFKERVANVMSTLVVKVDHALGLDSQILVKLAA